MDVYFGWEASVKAVLEDGQTTTVIQVKGGSKVTREFAL